MGKRLIPVTAKFIWRQPGKTERRPNKFGRYKSGYLVDYKGNVAPPSSEGAGGGPLRMPENHRPGQER